MILSSKELEIVINSDLRGSQVSIQQETVGAIEVVVVTDFAEAESGSELLGCLPCDTGLERHGIVASVIEQAEVTAEVHEQGELLSDGATHITDVGLKSQSVSGVGDYVTKNLDLVLIEAVTSAKGDLPMVVDHITHFRGDGEARVVLLNASAEATADPNLSIGRENACEGKY